jgi:hypothetical protein
VHAALLAGEACGVRSPVGCGVRLVLSVVVPLLVVRASAAGLFPSILLRLRELSLGWMVESVVLLFESMVIILFY